MRASTLPFLGLLFGCTDAVPDKGPADTGSGEVLTLTVHGQVATILRATWDQPTATDASWVAYEFGDTLLTTPVVARPAGPAEVSLLGIPAETAVTATVYDGDGVEIATATGETGALPADLVSPSTLSWDPTRASPERWALLTVDMGQFWYQGPFYAVIVDREGRIVWYWEVPDGRGAFYTQPGWDGSHVLVDGDTAIVFDDTILSTYYRMTLDLARLDATVLPDFRFAFDEEENGAVLFVRRVNTIWTLARHDVDGTDTDLWSCTAFFASMGMEDHPCAANTIVWDAARRTVLYSMPDDDIVVEIDADSGELLKQFGSVEGAWTLTPEEAGPDLQHYPNWTPDGTILLSTHVHDAEGQMRAREFAVDDDAQTLTEIWSYGEGSSHYAEKNGEAVRLDNGDTLIGYGTEGSLLEVSAEGDILWDLEWPPGDQPPTYLIGHATLVDDLYALNGEAP